MKTEQSARIARTNYYLGIFLLAFILALELVFFQTISLEKFIVEKLFASFLLYSSALLKLETIEKHPIKKSLSHIKQSRDNLGNIPNNKLNFKRRRLGLCLKQSRNS